MSKIFEDLFIGDFSDASNRSFLERHNIKAIVSILDGEGDEARQRKKQIDEANNEANSEITYLAINIDDSPFEFMDVHFSNALSFIHQARSDGKNVLIHCLYGISRSVTILVAYLMTISGLSWTICLNAVKKRRPQAQPNDGFVQQLHEYQQMLAKMQTKYKPTEMEKYRNYASREQDIKIIKELDAK